jgi:lipoate-protein ligase A
MPFDTLLLLEDPPPRAAPIQMAIDQILLARATQPILRIYTWASPCVTMGYFESWQATQVSFPRLEITRRWTGGGSVAHVDDWPYSLIVPHSHPFARTRPAESYRQIHAKLARILSRKSHEIELASSSEPKRSSACFENPVQYDILMCGEKVAGAGQRRSNAGLLHQGSLQLPALLHPDGATFAAAIAAHFECISLPREILQEAELLANERYANPAWIRAR